MNELMKRVSIRKPGGINRLVLEDFEFQSGNEDLTPVKVSHIGVNYADCCVRRGVYESAKEYVGWPITPGFEFAGVRAGDPSRKVFGVTRFGAYAEGVAVPEHQLFDLPSKLTPAQAAAFPAVFLTAYHALFQLINIERGSHILIHSAAGGVGSALIQLAKILDCHVVGVVGSSHKVEYCKKLGADKVIDKSREDLWTMAKKYSPQGYDVILDANGPSTLKASYDHLRPIGKLITYGFHTMLPKDGKSFNPIRLARDWLRIPRFNPLDLVQQNKTIAGFNLSFLFDRRDILKEGMDQLIEWVESGKITAPEIEIFDFANVGQAHLRLESGKTVGKLVLQT